MACENLIALNESGIVSGPCVYESVCKNKKSDPKKCDLVISIQAIDERSLRRSLPSDNDPIAG